MNKEENKRKKIINSVNICNIVKVKQAYLE